MKLGVDSKVTAKGQTTIPLEIREFLKIGPGDRIRFVIIDGRVEIIPRNRPASDLFGMLAQYGIPGTTLEDYDWPWIWLSPKAARASASRASDKAA